MRNLHGRVILGVSQTHGAAMKNRKLWLVLTLLATLAVAGLIFFFSSQKAEDSDRVSAAIVEPTLRALFPDYRDMSAETLMSLRRAVTFAVRKLAHFSLFTVLGLCLMGHVWVWRPEKPLRPTALLAWGISALYAASDEVHQMLVDGRSPELRDVAIDCAGALCGILFLWLLLWLIARRRQ